MNGFVVQGHIYFSIFLVIILLSCTCYVYNSVSNCCISVEKSNILLAHLASSVF